MMEFTKPALSIDRQIALLKNRGLFFPDEDRARRYLQTIGYYRLSAYFIPFQKTKDVFDDGTDFNRILNLYINDRKLRLIVMDAVERIEVAVRTAISNFLCEKYGPHWFLETDVFEPKFLSTTNRVKSDYHLFLENIHKATGKNNPKYRNEACKHYYRKYSQPAYPPSWVVIEVLPLGTWSRIFAHIRKTGYKKRISNLFNFDHNDFKKWIHTITLIRNKCAHHGRLWNHVFPPKASNIEKYTHPGIKIDTPYSQFAIIQAFLSSFTNKSGWPNRLFDLLKDWPLNINEHMKFPNDWEQKPFWRIQADHSTIQTAPATQNQESAA